jgi:hypothetical protein
MVGEYERRLRAIMLKWPERCDVINAVADLALPDCWLAAGFVRNTVWDCMHGRSALTPLNDVDVAYFEPADIDRAFESAMERSLRRSFPGVVFSVKNQARMHHKNRHQPYVSATDAISRWTETCTAVGVRRSVDGLDVCAPHGLVDLFSLVVRPTSFDNEYLTLVRGRVQDRGWLERWPRLRVILTPAEAVP